MLQQVSAPVPNCISNTVDQIKTLVARLGDIASRAENLADRLDGGENMIHDTPGKPEAVPNGLFDILNAIEIKFHINVDRIEAAHSRAHGMLG